MKMHFDWKGIMEGAWNSIFVKKNIEEIADKRIEICRLCPHDSEVKRRDDPQFISLRFEEHCTLCGCNLHMKTRSLSQVCPDDPPRWEAVMTQQEEIDLDQKIADEDRKNKVRLVNRN